MTDRAGCDPQVVGRNHSTRIQAGFDTGEFFAELHVVRNYDSGLYVLLKLGNPPSAPLSLYGPKVQLADSDK